MREKEKEEGNENDDEASMQTYNTESHSRSRSHIRTHPMSYENKSEHAWFCVNPTNGEAHIAHTRAHR